MRKRCKRKVYRTDVDPIRMALEGAGMTEARDLDRLRTVELSALASFVHGAATLNEWQQLVDMLNLCETMARGKIGPEALEACERAQAVLIDMSKQYKAEKFMMMDPVQLAALRDVYAYHDLQRQSISRGEYERWIKITGDRIRSKAPETVDISEI